LIPPAAPAGADGAVGRCAPPSSAIAAAIAVLFLFVFSSRPGTAAGPPAHAWSAALVLLLGRALDEVFQKAL